MFPLLTANYISWSPPFIFPVPVFLSSHWLKSLLWVTNSRALINRSYWDISMSLITPNMFDAFLFGMVLKTTCSVLKVSCHSSKGQICTFPFYFQFCPGFSPPLRHLGILLPPLFFQKQVKTVVESERKPVSQFTWRSKNPKAAEEEISSAGAEGVLLCTSCVFCPCAYASTCCSAHLWQHLWHPSDMVHMAPSNGSASFSKLSLENNTLFKSWLTEFC